MAKEELMGLHPVQHTFRGTCYCGHAALSAVTGENTRTVRSAVRSAAEKYRGRDVRVRGILVKEMCQALQWMGMTGRFTRSFPVRLKDWLVDDRDPGTTYIVIVARHYIAVYGDRFVDSMQKIPTSIAAIPSCYLNATVKGYIEVTR